MAEGKSLKNIFSLVRGKQEDQLSIDFGFVLKNYPKILDVFLRKIGISLSKKELKVVDIETQTTYNSGESRIDLHIEAPNRFLIFIESIPLFILGGNVNQGNLFNLVEQAGANQGNFYILNSKIEKNIRNNKIIYIMFSHI